MAELLADPVLTKHQLAYRFLRRAILEGSLPPGSRIVISKVSADLGMSPIPIREAISQLAKEGLLTMKPHVGAVVSDIPLHAIEEIFALLESLEITAVRLALPNLSSESFQALDELCDQMESAGDVGEWAMLNRRFHESVSDLAGFTRVSEFLIRVGEDWERLRKLRFSGSYGEDLSESNQQHREFVRLLRDGKLPQVEKLIRDHNRQALRKYKAMVDEK